MAKTKGPRVLVRVAFFTKGELQMRFLLLFALTFFTTLAHAYVVPVYRDLKPASQAMLENQRVPIPIVALATRVVTGAAGPTSAAIATLSTFTLQPDVPRNLTVTPGGTTGDVEACVVTVTGTNILGRVISEAFTFIADASTAQTGVKAFKTVTSASWAASCESGGFAATWSIGVGDALGLKACMRQAGDVAWAVFNGVFEATRPTCVADVDEVEKNTCDVNGTLDGAKNVDIFFVQNFACLP